MKEREGTPGHLICKVWTRNVTTSLDCEHRYGGGGLKTVPVPAMGDRGNWDTPQWGGGYEGGPHRGTASETRTPMYPIQFFRQDFRLNELFFSPS